MEKVSAKEARLMSTGFLFPGQGSQKLGMLADIPEMYMERLENVTGYR